VNEVENDPPSPIDEACQYAELVGAPGYVVPAGSYFLSVDGASGNFGAVTNAVNLSGVTVGSNGTITIILDPVNIADCSGRIYDGGTTLILIDDAFQVVGGNDSSSPAEAESFLVVSSLTAIIDGDDIDVDNNKVIDPALGITVVDGFAITVDDVQQAAYAPVIYNAIAQGGGSAELPDAAARIPGNILALTAAAWRYGELGGADTAVGPFSAPTNSAGYNLTPSAPNNP
jgi:hypothetical protein